MLGDRLNPFWKGALGAVVALAAVSLLVGAVLAVLWAYHGQQAYNFILGQLQAQQAQQKAAQGPPK